MRGGFRRDDAVPSRGGGDPFGGEGFGRASEHLLISVVSNQSKVLEKAREEGYFIVALDWTGALVQAKVPWKRPIMLMGAPRTRALAPS